MDETIFALTELTSVASNDVFPVVDVSDTTDGPNGTTKKIQQVNIAPDKAPLNSPIFSGIVTIPTNPVIGTTTILASGEELNQSVGVTSPIQTQLNGKQPLNGNLTTIGGLVDPNADEILFWDDSASAYSLLSIGSGLQIVGTVLSAIGTGGGYTLLAPTSGAVNSVNTLFPFSQQPLFVVSDGVWYRVNKGWTWTGSAVQLTIPGPSDDLYGLV